METKRLKYAFTDYRFAVSDNNYLYPEDGPGLVIQRVFDGIIVGCSNYGRFIGTESGDPTHMERLRAVARFLTHMLHLSDELGVYSLFDIRVTDVYMYEKYFCPEGEVAYIGEFVHNLARAGLLTNITVKDTVMFT